MRSHFHPDPNRREGVSVRILTTILFLFAIYELASVDASAQCQIGFRPASSIADANINGIQGTKWDDASVIRSGDPCMNFLPDWDQTTVVGGHAVPALNRTVSVLSKRDDSNTALYMAFDIPDTTRDRRNDPNPGTVVGPLGPGERIVIQFDPDNAHGTTLNNDFRIDVSHIWGNVGGDITFVTKTFSNSSGAAGTLCPDPSFAATAFPAGIIIKARVTPAGYFIEFKVPLSALGPGPITNDIGVAFAVINDLGYHDSDGNDDAAGISFPTALPIVNDGNPIFNECAWTHPNQWGRGFFSTGLTDVTISRNPVWWDSNAITVFACATPNYIYYPAHPCFVSVRATLQNSGSATTRHLLYLWAEHGANPSVWRVIALQENVAVPAGGGTMPLSGQLTSPLIKNKPNHPCVRVYILPPGGFRVDFDKNAILGITSQSQLDVMVSKYGLQDQHNAQKNITRHTTTTDCPDAACRIALKSNPLLTSPADVTAQVSDAFRFDSLTGTTLLGQASLESPRSPVLNAHAAPTQQATQPHVSTTGHPMLLSDRDFAEFGQDNVIVQVRAFAHSKHVGSSSYSFLQEVGGVMQVFPVSMFKEDKTIPFELNVGNPGTIPRTIFLHVDLYVPPGTLSDVKVNLDSGPKEFAAGETKVAKGTVTAGSPAGGNFKRWGLSLHAGVSIPHGNFSNIFDPGPNFAVDLEYRFHPLFSIEGIYGLHHFNGTTIGGFTFSDVNVHQFSLNGKVYGSTSPVRPFFNFGGGAYHVTPSTHGGLNVGGGVQFDVTPSFAVEGMYNFHNVFLSGSNFKFSGVQGGVRFRF